MPATSKVRRDAPETWRRLRALHHDADCELTPRDPFQLLVAVVLSAQTTDVAVNKVTPGLFGRYPDAASLARADVADVEQAIKTIGMYRQKAKNIVGIARALVDRHGGEVPRDIDALVQLPGVGRKSANVVLGTAFGIPTGVVVDTHVQRLAQRLGWTKETKPERIEQDLMKLFPVNDWIMLSHVLIFHGRRVCTARAPACASCPVSDVCPSAGKAEEVGRKPRQERKRDAGTRGRR